MKLVTALLTLLLAGLQYPLWLGSGSASETWRLRQAIAVQVAQNERLRERNQALEAEVVDLKSGVHAIEERARSELGMIREGEVFFQVVGN